MESIIGQGLEKVPHMSIGATCSPNTKKRLLRHRLYNAMQDVSSIILRSESGTKAIFNMEHPDLEETLEEPLKPAIDKDDNIVVYPLTSSGKIVLDWRTEGDYGNERFDNGPLELSIVNCGVLDLMNSTGSGLNGRMDAYLRRPGYTDHIGELMIRTGYKFVGNGIKTEVPYDSVSIVVGRSEMSPIEGQQRCSYRTVLHFRNIEIGYLMKETKEEKKLVELI